ncbi:MAG TPA: DUF4192 domain-containing protein [Ornithinibacter sp.]|nr:DUF4192 domain-containing protein [Ornithinibacter sp.]
MTADITLRGPGDIVAVLPYHLGYHPRDSVVAVSLRGRLLGLVARADIPPPGHEDAVASWLVGPLVRDGASSVIVVGFEDEPDAARPVVLCVAEHLERAGVEVLDVTVVRDGRRFSPRCAKDCCPPEGVVLPEPADVPGVAEYVARGRSPLVSRDAVDGLVEPDRDASQGVADAIAARGTMSRRRLRRRSAAAWAVALRHPCADDAGGGVADHAGRGQSPARARGGPAASSVLADLALGLHDIAWRDGLIAWLAPGVLPVEDLEAAAVRLLESSLPAWGGMGFDSERGAGRDELLQRLLMLCRCMPDEVPDEAAAVCTVVAHVAWAGGDGSLARTAVDRALRLVPDYRLARLLERLIDNGIRFPLPERDGEPTGESGMLDRAG